MEPLLQWKQEKKKTLPRFAWENRFVYLCVSITVTRADMPKIPGFPQVFFPPDVQVIASTGSMKFSKWEHFSANRTVQGSAGDQNRKWKLPLQNQVLLKPPCSSCCLQKIRTAIVYVWGRDLGHSRGECQAFVQVTERLPEEDWCYQGY